MGMKPLCPQAGPVLSTGRQSCSCTAGRGPWRLGVLLVGGAGPQRPQCEGPTAAPSVPLTFSTVFCDCQLLSVLSVL